MIAALLIGREGSKGFPGKNVYPIMGRPMVEYPLLAAKECSLVDRVYVSTDSQKIKDIAKKLDISIIERPPELADAKALGDHAFVHGYQKIKEEWEKKNEKIEILILLFANAVTVSPQLIKDGIEVLRKDPSVDSAVSVSCYNMWSPLRARKIGDDGLLHPFVPFETFGDPKTLNCDRDSQGDVWFADMGLSVIRPKNLETIDEGLLPQRWMGQNIFPLKQTAGLDVDYEWQVPQAEFWLKSQKGQNK